MEAARAVLRSLSHRTIKNILNFTETSYKLGSITIAAGSAFDGLCLNNFQSIVKEDSLVTLLENETGYSRKCIFPSGSTILKKGDRIHILTKEAQMDHIFNLAGRYEKPLKRIGILGGGRIGTLIADGILRPVPENGIIHSKRKRNKFYSIFNYLIPDSSRQVVIVEQNYEVCKELAGRYSEALILNEDISDESFIAEERLGHLDLIITATANQELNIITAIYLKSRGVKRAIALVSGSGHEAIARQLGVDVVIPMQSVVVDSILSSLMSRGLRGVYSLGDGTQEILETEIRQDSPAAGKALTEFKLSNGGLIMLVNREGTSFIPKGDYVFNSGDKIIIIAKSGSEPELEKFFGLSK